LAAKKNLIKTYLPATASRQNEYADEVRGYDLTLRLNADGL
jgi:hypothetical protein